MTAERMRDDERIELDGVLDEPVWKRAQHGGEFIMQDPVLGGTPTERTEVRIVFNQDHLYIGVTCHDSEPDKLLGNTRKRDEFLSADDRFMWTIDTFLNQQTGYFFEMNPSGLMADALMGPSGDQQPRVGRHLERARPAQRDRLGARDRPAVPHPRLRSERAGVGHQLPAHGAPEERGARSGPATSATRGCAACPTPGCCVGLTDVTQGLGLELKPYLAGRVDDAPGRVPRDRAGHLGDVGIDVDLQLHAEPARASARSTPTSPRPRSISAEST